MIKTSLAFAFLFFSITSISQEDLPDTTRTLDEVTVKAFEQNRNAAATVSAVNILTSATADRYNKSSLVNGFNSISGVRMEERSPGSYRINIRGSSLRSPFGVRNIKVYWNNIPITDPGGNTYFNQFAHNNFSTIEIFKGPAGSLYGAGTGGLIILNNSGNWKPGARIEYMTGSYNLQNIFASAKFGKEGSAHQLTYAHNQSDGYRDQSDMRRDNFTWQSRIKTAANNELDASILYNDMYYQTPGALTLNEFNNNPKAARPAGGGFPSAINAKAAIFQKTVTAGFTNTYHFSNSFKNATTLYGAFAQIKNSAIRNYERRNEPGYGARTVFTFDKLQKQASSPSASYRFVGGGEYQQGYFNTQVAQNRNGNPDTIQTNDDINYTTYSIFLQGEMVAKDKWMIHAGVSLNKTKVQFSRLSRYPVTHQNRSYKNELAPRLAVRRNIWDNFYLKGTVSRGFSPPTVAELLPSTGVISTELEAESGWNYEITLHYELFNNALQLEATGVYFKLNNALVQRRDLSGADFFVNAGDVQQKSVELNADYFRYFRSGLISTYHFNVAYTYSHFRYGSFIKGSDDFSGNIVPSVPGNTLSLMADLTFSHGFYFNSTFYKASKIYLNDANTAFAPSYHNLGARLGWKKNLKKNALKIYVGADNLTDEKYSLGNDINAAANRFYNAAPGRNYYFGVSLSI